MTKSQRPLSGLITVTNDYVHKLEKIILDILDGKGAWYEIQEDTGLSDKKCKTIEKLYEQLYKKYNL